MRGAARVRAQAGSAFLLALWFAAAASGLALALLDTSREAVPEARRQIDSIRLRAALSSAVHVVAARLSSEKLELRAGTAVLELAHEDIAVSVRVRAESGLVDVAAASPGLVQRLAELVGFDRERARALVDDIERRRTGTRSGDPPENRAPQAFRELRPPDRPGLDHPIEVVEAAGGGSGPSAGPWDRFFAFLTLGTDLPEPVVELAPREVRIALAGTKGDRSPRSSPQAEVEPVSVRRRDPNDLYRLEILARTPGERMAARRVVLALRPGDIRPVRIVDWSGPLAVGGSSEPDEKS
ncbi:MAG: hypothetical protein RMJ04_05575 [Geminicoccaceae bacterium]|nr:hypothetical protein [Geminicoccaceae bacterium]